MNTIVIKQQFFEKRENQEEIIDRFAYFSRENMVTTLLVAGKLNNRAKTILKELVPGIKIKTIDEQEKINYDEKEDRFEVLKKYYYLDIGSAMFIYDKYTEILYFDLLSQYCHKDSFTLEYLSEQINDKLDKMKKIINSKKLN
ncbi:MAG: hypothetical protein RSG07_00265 [Erysipelotrichaceae bacterium]